MNGIQEILKKYFGYDQFRPMQEDIINTILNGKDAVVIMPTGGGKSLCFQIPALYKPGICIVISPLIALMKDQVEGLRINGIAAEFLNSSLSTAEQSTIESQAINGKLKFLYISPEKLLTNYTLIFLKKLDINLIAIDEAHCISTRGHDFRLEYTKLNIIKEILPNIPIIALTATADKITRADIISQLNIPNSQIFLSSFDRPNLYLSILPGQDKLKQIIYFLAKHKDEPGIIYCLSRNDTENIANKLRDKGYSANYYHAGMSKNDRSLVQEGFLKDDIQIMCATIAFGMGIDKSNIRWIIHYNLPQNIESYYQEIGRAGRDGLDAQTILFYSFADVMKLRKILDEGDPKIIEFKLSKLDRIKQYAESNICRRKLLLGYFGEILENDCGNCDVCRNPREKIDGTIIAQKILSAISRTQESTTITTIIDILRGSRLEYIYTHGYHNLKTYGICKDIPKFELNSYLEQLINLGFIEIAYNEAYHLKLNDHSRKILFRNLKIKLSKPKPYWENRNTENIKTKSELEPKNHDQKLFEILKKLRRQLAIEQKLAPYLLFHDVTLKELSIYKPINKENLLEIQGIGEIKYQKYGEIIINEIKKYLQI